MGGGQVSSLHIPLHAVPSPLERIRGFSGGWRCSLPNNLGLIFLYVVIRTELTHLNIASEKHQSVSHAVAHSKRVKDTPDIVHD